MQSANTIIIGASSQIQVGSVNEVGCILYGLLVVMLVVAFKESSRLEARSSRRLMAFKLHLWLYIYRDNKHSNLAVAYFKKSSHASSLQLRASSIVRNLLSNNLPFRCYGFARSGFFGRKIADGDVGIPVVGDVVDVRAVGDGGIGLGIEYPERIRQGQTGQNHDPDNYHIFKYIFARHICAYSFYFKPWNNLFLRCLCILMK